MRSEATRANFTIRQITAAILHQKMNESVLLGSDSVKVTKSTQLWEAEIEIANF